MRTDIHVGIFDILIILGVFQGVFLSWFFIKSVQKNKQANLFQGLLLLSLSLVIFEEWLNNTGFIVRVLSLTNFSEPLNFAMAPLFYLYIRSSLNPGEKSKSWLHFLLTVFWLFYMVFSFIQSDEYKYNGYISTKHPDWGFIDQVISISDDPLGIRKYVNQLTLVQFLVYLTASVVILLKKFRSDGQHLLKTDNVKLVHIRNSEIHFILIVLLYIATKLFYGMTSDIGNYVPSAYISFMIYATSYQMLNRSDFLNQSGSFLSFPITKYQRSSLSDENKEVIMSKITIEMEDKEYFTNNLASLSGLSKSINESSHHVSQVINEGLGKNFFELLASYRVEYAKKLIMDDKDAKLTVDELAEMVGYNSKSSFYSAFKSHTSQTPAEYRKSLHNQ